MFFIDALCLNEEQFFKILILIILIKDMDSNKYVLGYWGLRGRGQVLRLLLSYTGL